MRRNSNDMQVNVAGIRRNLKNLAHNYSDAQRKVREATSNDAWGPSSTIMAEIADLTYNVVAFSEIMQMVWKRLNDHGKNWRHVYKALLLLEYLIKTGSEKVGQQCKENIFAIQTLKDFQYLEEGKDQGSNVREKAKQLVNLLKDDERLKNERARALKAKERFAQSASGFGSDGGLDTPSSPRYPAFKGDWNTSRDSTDLPRDIEVARPQTAGEEELQLQLALAMSREEADQEEQKRKSDDVRLQLALSQSQQDFKVSPQEKPEAGSVDLLDVNFSNSNPPVDAWGFYVPPSMQQPSPWQQKPPLISPATITSEAPLVDPWIPSSSTLVPKPDPWGGTVGTGDTTGNRSPLQHSTPAKHDPWSPTSQSSTDLDEFDVITNRNKSASPHTNGANNNNASNDPFDLNLLGDTLPSTGPETSASASKKTPLSFLGENSALVNLDNLVTSNKQSNPTLIANPFSDPSAAPASTAIPARPIFNTPVPKPSINEIKQQSYAPFVAPNATFVPPSATNLHVASFGGTGSTQFPPLGPMFSTNGSAFSQMPATQDPWAPIPSTNGSANMSSAWTKSNEPANPFLS